MKATKKIVGAAVALVAAVALSAGSTFAWFAQSNVATATNMVVKTTVPTNLLITKGYKTSADEVKESTISFASDSEHNTLSPCAVSNEEITSSVTELTNGGVELSDKKFYVAKANEYSEKPTAGTPGTVSSYTALSTGEVGASGITWETTDTGYQGYVKYFDMTLANKGDAADSTAISALVVAEATGENNDSIKCVRAGLLVGYDGTYKLYSSKNDVSEPTYKWTYNNIATEVAKDGLVTVSLLIWFDGNDTDCTIAGVGTVNNITFKIAFNASSSALSEFPTE